MKKERLINDILNVYNEYGYINRKILTSKITDYNVDFQLSKYGGLKKISRELGIEYRQYSRIDPNDIKEDFLRVYKEHGEIGKEIYEQYGKYSSSAVISSFGNYTNLFDELNIPHNININVSKEDVIKDFLDFHNKYNTVSSTKYRKNGRYAESTINLLFGSWESFLNEIGFKPMNKKVGKEKMIDDVKSLYEKYGFLSANLINQNCEFTYQALSYHFSMDMLCDIVGDKDAFTKSKSTGSKELKLILDNLYDDVIEEATFDWLINPKSGKLMYIDYYVPSENIAFEYDGQQHNCYIEYFYKRFKDFYNSVYRDRMKEKLLAKHNVKLVRIRYDEPLTEDYVKSKCSI